MMMKKILSYRFFSLILLITASPQFTEAGIIQLGLGVSSDAGDGSREINSDGRKIFRPFFAFYSLGTQASLDLKLGFLGFTAGYIGSYAGGRVEYDYTDPNDSKGTRYREDIRVEINQSLIFMGVRIRLNSKGSATPLIGGGLMSGDATFRYNHGDYLADQKSSNGFIKSEKATLTGHYGEGGVEFVGKFLGLRLLGRGFAKETGALNTLGGKSVTLRGIEAVSMLLIEI